MVHIAEATHRDLEQVLIAVAGSFEVVVNDGRRSTTVRLDSAHMGFYIPTGMAGAGALLARGVRRRLPRARVLALRGG